MTKPNAPRTARQRARAELTREIAPGYPVFRVEPSER